MGLRPGRVGHEPFTGSLLMDPFPRGWHDATTAWSADARAHFVSICTLYAADVSREAGDGPFRKRFDPSFGHREAS